MERDLSPDEFRRYHDVIHRLTGIHYPEDKVQLLGNRLRKRMRITNKTQFADYLTFIQRSDQTAELQAFIDSITTNETYMFRCKRHWDLFAEWVKDTAQKGAQSFRIWSAAASNGSEACTILMVLDQVLGREFGGRRVELLGTDLSQSVLQEAKAAVYRPYALSQTPKEVVDRYFKQIEADRFEFDRRLLRHATFRLHNLMEPLSTPAPFDFVFLRNVMIYFDRPSKERVLQHVSSVLRPGGMLMVGESESLLNVNHGFSYQRPSWFQKPTSLTKPQAPQPQPQPSKA